MKIVILVGLLSLALAEPPVGDGYAAARSSHDHHHSHHHDDTQRSLSREYGVPAGGHHEEDHVAIDARSSPAQIYGPPARSSLSQEYGPPNLRSGLSQEYGPPNLRSGLSQEYGPPSLRSTPSEEYGVPSARGLSQQYGPPEARNAISTEYGTPSTRSQDNSITSAHLSQEYGVPQLRSESPQEYKTIGDYPSDSYGAPLQRSPSESYGAPEFRSTPSQEYGIPSQTSFGQTPAQKYGPPSFRNAQSPKTVSQEHSSPLARTSSKPSSVSTRTFHSSFGSRTSPAQGYSSARSQSPHQGVSSARSFGSHSRSSHSSKSSQSYLPSSRTVSQTYGVPNERSLSSEYGPPEARTNLKTNAVASSFESSRTSAATKYGPPAAREAMPSEQYGVPEQYDNQSEQGYNYARNALDELLNQEPANYDFGYKVSDDISGSDFGHTETRQDNRAEGSYFVVLPDGSKQIVEYEADERGFKPRISVEPAETRAGYDENAANLGRSNEGPY